MRAVDFLKKQKMNKESYLIDHQDLVILLEKFAFEQTVEEKEPYPHQKIICGNRESKLQTKK